jgi:hypothetical protein
MNTKLVLLRYDFERKAWMRAGAPVLFGEARRWSEAEARPSVRRGVARARTSDAPTAF